MEGAGRQEGGAVRVLLREERLSEGSHEAASWPARGNGQTQPARMAQSAMSRQSNSTRHSVGTASSARAKGKQRVQDSDSDDDSLQQHLSLVAPEFLHRPLSVEDSQVKLRTLVAELKACITQLTDGLEILQSMAIEVATATKKIVLSGDGDDEEMETEHEIEEDNVSVCRAVCQR